MAQLLQPLVDKLWVSYRRLPPYSRPVPDKWVLLGDKQARDGRGSARPLQRVIWYMALRIHSLTLTDFRAFPGPEPASFELDGKNLLVYGENGAGKSSLFHALREFFALKPSRRLTGYKNIFSAAPPDTPRVEVSFDDNSPPVAWNLTVATGGGFGTGGYGAGAYDGVRLIEHHPATAAGGSDPRVAEAALRRACLDYRALLDTNYKHGDGEINFFDIAVRHLVHDFPVTVSGGTSKTVGELWDAVERSAKAKPAGPRAGAAPRPALLTVNAACVEFNQGLNQALTALQPLVGTLLSDLIGADVTVAIPTFAGVTYSPSHWKAERVIAGKLLKMGVSFRAQALPTPQSFLNEARLSALALAIYLAGRLACTPSAPGTALKLLVLDDVLIGLDHSNRLPVLDMLRQHFSDWQIVLLTHDHVWFEMVRFYLADGDRWKCLEIFESLDPVRGIPAPIMRPLGDNPADTSLRQAQDLLNSHYVPAAANYTRAAFELALKSFCEKRGVPVPFKMDSRELKTEALLTAVENWWAGHSSKSGIGAVVERVKLFRKVVLNPYSHASPPNIAAAEVQGAIHAINDFVSVTRQKGLSEPLVKTAATLASKANPTAFELHAALGYLRAAFSVSLRRFCERKQLKLPLTTGLHDTLTLWSAVMADQARLFPAPDTAMPTMIDAERQWLVAAITDTDLVALTAMDLIRIRDAFAPGSVPSLDTT